MKPPYWLYLETSIEKDFLLSIMHSVYFRMNEDSIHRKECKNIIERLETM